jgi:hypothetical protein
MKLIDYFIDKIRALNIEIDSCRNSLWNESKDNIKDHWRSKLQFIQGKRKAYVDAMINAMTEYNKEV